MCQLGIQSVQNICMYSVLVLVFCIGNVLKRVPMLKRHIAWGFNRLIGTCLPAELYWDSLFTWRMLNNLWHCIQLDTYKKIKQGSKAYNTPVFCLDGNNNQINGNSVTTSRLLDHAKSGRPLVLNFGSYSCPVFRAQMSDFRAVVEKYESFADFAVVYIEEAHPSDGWALQNEIPIPFHKSIEDRCAAARLLMGSHNPGCKILIDSLLNASSIAYGATPIRLHVILDERIAFEGGAGPMMYDIRKVNHWLENWVEGTNQK